MTVDNLLKKGRPESGRPWFCRCCRDVSGNVSTKGVCDTGVCDTPLRDYFLMKVFVATPSSVVTRTKYMPLARPLTLMRMGE